jgi:hypothetical protein
MYASLLTAGIHVVTVLIACACVVVAPADAISNNLPGGQALGW